MTCESCPGVLRDRTAQWGSGFLYLLLSMAATAAQEAPRLPPPDHPKSWPPRELYRAALIRDQLGQATQVSQLLLNLRTALRKDYLLQPAFYEDAVLFKFLGGKELQWQETTESSANAVTLIREGHMRVDTEGLPRMTVSIRERITPQASDVVRGQEPVFPIALSGSITVHFELGPTICVCDVRNGLGWETGVDVGDARSARESVSYELAEQSPGVRKKSAIFFVKPHQKASEESINAPTSIHGSDEVEEFTVSEESGDT
jgi:hypothetical protein